MPIHAARHAPRGKHHPFRILSLLLLLAGSSGCAVGHLLAHGIRSAEPGWPRGGELALPGLEAPVEVRRSSDGFWRVQAASETDGARALGYLQARDRAFQLDLLRHLAQGRLTELLGNRPMGARTALETDIENRFLGLDDDARRLRAEAGEREVAILEAFAAGISHWYASGRRSLEHRLLGVREIRPWTAHDSLTVYAFFAHGLAGNANREIRRLLLACRTGVEGMERIWPSVIDAEDGILPELLESAGHYRMPPAVVPELAQRLPDLCPPVETEALPAAGPTASLDILDAGWEGSNNWLIASAHTESGAPILANDPHLPMMSPPILWGYELDMPQLRVAGFSITGLPLLVFGHNGRVAWAQTTHHVDRQDLYVLDLVHDAEGQLRGYRWEDGTRAFEWREERFRIRGGDTVTHRARFSVHGPVLNDLDPFLDRHAPPVALTRSGIGRGTDLIAARRMNEADSVAAFARAITGIDGDCSNWLIADIHGDIAYRTPCVLPERRAHLGTFPAPGWGPDWLWGPMVAKEDMPSLDNPARGWLGSANSRVLPLDRFPVPQDADPSADGRFQRLRTVIEAKLAREEPWTVADSLALQVDLQLPRWPELRAAIDTALCGAPWGEDADLHKAAKLLCDWDGHTGADSVGSTLQVLLTHALLDLALTDELPGGSDDPVWDFVQRFPQFESNVQRLWREPVTAAVWNDVRTPRQETRDEILRQALTLVVDEGRRRWGPPGPDWAWGTVRPFVLRHPFAAGDGLLSRIFNPPALPGVGEVNTLWKSHHLRADRERMHVAVGAVIRLVVDMADPWAARYVLAGGQSGWPGSRHYGDQLPIWNAGESLPLTPPPSLEDRMYRLLPAAGTR